MYQIDKNQNRINRLEEKTFAQLGFKEREHLQEWIANDPECLGEELLIIQKEFSGFEDTRERLDLLAVDKQGNLVIIENKLDDSGRDVTWQVLKYASYCSSLSKDDIRSIFQDYLKKEGMDAGAEEQLSEFLEKEDFSEVQLNQGSAQRIMMIAASFRKEVTSTVLWLMNFNIRVQCFKITPYVFQEQLFLNFDQILPVKDAQEYSVSMASKAQEEIAMQESLKKRQHLRIDFWRKFLDYANSKHQLYSNNSPSKGSLGTGVGLSGFGINLKISGNYARAELFINPGKKELNKACFDFLLERKDQIEKEFGGELTWERMNENITSRIKSQLDGVSLYDKEDWDQMIKYLTDVSVRMDRALRAPLKQLSRKLKQGNL